MNRIRAFNPAVLSAFLCFASTTVIFSPNASVFRGSGEPAFMAWFIFPLFLGALATSLIWGIAQRTHIHTPLESSNVTFSFAVASVYAISTCCFIIPALSIATPPIIPAIAGFASGCALVLICSKWAEILSALNFREAIAFSACACIGSSLIGMGLSLLPLALRVVLFCIGVLVSGFAPFFLSRMTAQQTGSAASQYLTSPHDPHNSEDRARVTVRQTDNESSRAQSDKSEEEGSFKTSDLIATMKLPAIALIIYAFMMSVMKYQPLGLVDGEYIGGALAALCIIPLLFIKEDKPLSSLLYRVIAPIIGGIVIVLVSLPPSSVVHSIALVGVYVFLSALAILALAQIIAIMNAGEFPAAFVTCTALASGSVVSLIGLIWTKLFGGLSDYQPIVFVLISLYCALMLISFGWESWQRITQEARPNNANNNQASSTPFSRGLPRIPKSLSDKLTNRENEILVFLGRGYSISYIAEKLFISESTVRTHVKHIYAKLGIHSREDLFALIDQSAEVEAI